MLIRRLALAGAAALLAAAALTAQSLPIPPDGGMAFPGARTEEHPTARGGTELIYVAYSGVSMRDYFAAHAPAAHATTPAQAYAWADGMLAERARTR